MMMNYLVDFLWVSKTYVWFHDFPSSICILTLTVVICHWLKLNKVTTLTALLLISLQFHLVKKINADAYVAHAVSTGNIKE